MWLNDEIKRSIDLAVSRETYLIIASIITVDLTLLLLPSGSQHMRALQYRVSSFLMSPLTP